MKKVKTAFISIIVAILLVMVAIFFSGVFIAMRLIGYGISILFIVAGVAYILYLLLKNTDE